MTALANDQNVEYQPTGRNVYEVLITDIIYAGGLVGVNAGGFLEPWANDAADEFIGIAMEGENGVVVGAGSKVAVNDEGGLIKHIPIASAVQGSVGELVFCTTDNVLADCALTATSRAIGRIIRFATAGDCDIQVFSHTEFAAFAAA